MGTNRHAVTTVSGFREEKLSTGPVSCPRVSSLLGNICCSSCVPANAHYSSAYYNSYGVWVSLNASKHYVLTQAQENVYWKCLQNGAKCINYAWPLFHEHSVLSLSKLVRGNTHFSSLQDHSSVKGQFDCVLAVFLWHNSLLPPCQQEQNS